MSEQRPISLDEEFDQIEKENIDAGIQDSDDETPDTPEPQPETPVETPDPEPSTDSDDEDDELETPELPAPTPEKVEEPAGDKDDLDASQHKRPARYIPIPQYKAEKQSWEQEKAKLENDLRTATEALSGIKTDKAPVTVAEKKDVSAKIQAYAESRNMDVADVQELADTLKDAIFGGNFEKFNSIIENQERSEQEKKLDEEDARVFAEQFATDVVPLLKQTYPTATNEQIAKMRDHMDMLGHTPKLAQTPLDYIFHGHRNDFDAIVNGNVEPEAKPAENKRSAMGGRSGASKGFSAADFAGKTDFSELMNLSQDQQDDIMRKMDVKTYDAFTKYVADQDRDTVVVTRNGRKVVLK